MLGTVGTEQTFEGGKLQETGTMARWSGSIRSIQNISCFFFYFAI